MSLFSETKDSIESFERDVNNDLRNFENLPPDLRQQRIEHIEDSLRSMDEYIKEGMIATYTDANPTQVQNYLREKQRTLEILKSNYQNSLQRTSLMSGIHTNIRDGENQLFIDQKKKADNMENLNDHIISNMGNALDIGNDIVSEMDRQREVGDSMQSHLEQGDGVLDETESSLKKIQVKRFRKIICTWVIVLIAIAFLIVFFYFVFRPVK